MASLLGVITKAIEKRKVHLWPMEAKEALVRVLYEVYRADGRFSEAELAEYRAFVMALGVDAEQALGQDLRESFAMLTRTPGRQRVATAWIAAALFANQAYSPAEQAFVERITSKYGLDAPLLKQEIRRIQGRLLDQTLRDALQRS